MRNVGSIILWPDGLRLYNPKFASSGDVPFEVDNSAVLVAVVRLGLEALWILAEGDEQLSFQVVELAEAEDGDEEPAPVPTTPGKAGEATVGP